MNPNVLVAAITTAGSVAVAVTALVLAYRGMNSLERRLELIEGDLKQFFRSLGEPDPHPPVSTPRQAYCSSHNPKGHCPDYEEKV